MAEYDNNQTNQYKKNDRKRNQADLSSVVYGKVPPQAPDLEEAVLGAFMIDRDAVTNAIEILRAESFYDDRHRIIFAAIRRLFEKTQPIDLLTVTEELRKMGQLEEAGGPFYVTSLTNRVASAAHIEHHARIVTQKFIQRELIRISSEIVHDSYEDTTDVFELLDKAEQNLFNIADKNLRTSYNEINNLLSATIKEIDEARKHEDSLTGCPSGFSNLDRVTGGWQKSDLIIVAARPAMGKTAFTLSLARNAAVDFNKGVAIFSLEMSSQQLVKRLLSAETEIPAEKIIKGHLAEHEMVQLVKLSGKLGEAPIFIDDTPAINIFELRAKCRRLKMQHDIQLVVIDYLQLMSGGGDKGMNREDRGGSKRPMLSDLRESGAIEQDADLVCFLYRPEYYGLDVDENGLPTKGIGEVMIAKHRNGALENVRVRFVDKFIKFVDLDEMYTPQNLTPLANVITDNKATITRKSKMDDMDNIDMSEEPPF